MKNDLKGMRAYLDRDREIFIYRNNKISSKMWNELIDIYSNAKNKADFIKCFEDVGDTEKRVYQVERICSICNKPISMHMSKSKIVEAIRKKEATAHKECKDKLRISQQAKAIADLMLLFDPKLDVTISKSNIETIFKNMIAMFNKVDTDLWYPKVKDMPYNDFLQTPYWKIVSYYKKYITGFKCEVCGATKDLQTHHISYKHHFFEHSWYYYDLKCLCKDCHTTDHNLKEDVIILKKK